MFPSPTIPPFARQRAQGEFQQAGPVAPPQEPAASSGGGAWPAHGQAIDHWEHAAGNPHSPPAQTPASPEDPDLELQPLRRFERVMAYGRPPEPPPELVHRVRQRTEELRHQPRTPPCRVFGTRPRSAVPSLVSRFQAYAVPPSLPPSLQPPQGRAPAAAPSAPIFGANLGPEPMLVQVGDEPFVVGPARVFDGNSWVSRPTGYHPPDGAQKRPCPSGDSRSAVRRRPNG